MVVNRNTRTKFRYSIALLLFTALCSAGIFGGYRAGFRQGYASGEVRRATEKPHPKVHQVGTAIRYAIGEDRGEIAVSGEYLNWLMAAIATCVQPNEWESLGGPCTMSPVPMNEALVVYAPLHIHEQIDALLGDLEGAKKSITTARDEARNRATARTEHLMQVLDPVIERVGEPLISISPDFSLKGTWQVSAVTQGPPKPLFSYEFCDGNVLLVASNADENQTSTDGWYIIGYGTLTVSGTGYYAATTHEGDLVLAEINDTSRVMVATRMRQAVTAEP